MPYYYFNPASEPKPLVKPANGDWYKASVAGTGRLAKDMSRGEFMSRSGNAELLNQGDPHYLTSLTVADDQAWLSQFNPPGAADSNLNGYFCIKGGMERLTQSLEQCARSYPNVEILTGCGVAMIDEKEDAFILSVQGERNKYRARKLILACNGRGIELIQWNSPRNRVAVFQNLFSQTVRASGFKMFLVYEKPWWNEHGLYTGGLNTDLPIGEVVAFGPRGNTRDGAILLGSFTYHQTEIFEGLNLPHYERFQSELDVKEELRPSKLLVEYIEDQLRLVFGENICKQSTTALQNHSLILNQIMSGLHFLWLERP